MRTNRPGFSVPEERMALLPFYYRNQSPEEISWEWFNWPYDARQRKFYQMFCGRVQGSIWMDECDPVNIWPQRDANQRQALIADVNSWTMPHIDVDTGYPMMADPYQNYLDMVNYRPANPRTGRAADATDVDELYIAPRISGDRMAFRIDMLLPDLTETLAGTELYIGFELNSQVNYEIYALRITPATATLRARSMRHWSPQYGHGGCSQADIPVTLNMDGSWATYVFEYDPPVFRFTQPTVGNRSPWTNPDCVELSVPGVPTGTSIQPFLYNMSTAIVGAGADTWYVGSWYIWQLYKQPNTYRIIENTGPSVQNLVFDTGGRSHVDVHVITPTKTHNVIVYGSSVGDDNVAGSPAARRWLPMRAAQTGVNADITGSFSYYGFLDNGYRFIKVGHDDNASGLKIIGVSANE